MPLTDRTVLFGGSFDPPHVGHSAICQWLVDALNAKRVIVAPTFEHCFGKKLVDFEHRVLMSMMMTQSINKCEVSIAEEFAPRPNYTINLIKNFIDGHPNTPLAIIVGGDLLSQIDKWKHWDEVAKLVKIIGIGRPGYNTESILSGIKVYPIGISTVSSSEVRKRILNKESLDGFVSHRIKEYILSNELYQ